MGEKLTRQDVEKIREEIDYRKSTVRREAMADLQEARAQGDVSENFEYYAAKRHKNQNESRIRYLENMLKNATVISEQSREGEVGLDDVVEVYFEDDDETETYKLVTSIRGDSMAGRISIESPIGKALRGRHVGDRCTVQVDSGISYEVEIRKIENTQDEENDTIREL